MSVTATSKRHTGVGDAAPELVYRDGAGKERRLSELWSEGPALIVWLRHFGWPFCMESLTQLREKLPEFEKRHVRLGCVVQGTAAEAAEVCGQYGMAEKCIPDPEKESYAKLGLDRTTLGAMVFASNELKARRRENRAAGFNVSIKKSFMPHCDIYQLPGAALVERGGKILWLHRGAHPGDLPSADELLDRVRQNQ